MTTFVLVHGGWQGGWSFKSVARLLRANGHDVYVATLTGLGERSHLAAFPVNLETHVSDVANMVLWEDLIDVVLVGHSYGGMVITAVADRHPNLVRTLVYLDAIVPKDGDSLLSLRPEYREVFLRSAAAADGRMVAAPAASARDARSEFWNQIDGKNVAHPLNCFTQGIKLTGQHKSVPLRIFIYAAGGSYEEQYRGFRDMPGNQVHGIADAGHSIMIDQPEAVSAILVSAVC